MQGLGKEDLANFSNECDWYCQEIIQYFEKDEYLKSLNKGNF